MSNKPFTIFRFLKNIGIMAGIFTVLLLFFFYIYLPATTNHNETITVPDLIGTSFDNIDELLTNRDLRYEVVVDSGYSERFDPETILSQNPKGGSKVKENRKIYLTLNANVPPQIRMPNLINTDLLNAEDILISNGLKRGEITYVPDLRENAVIKQQLEGEEIEPGNLIYKGSTIDLIIGNGVGIETFPIPDFLSKTLEELKFQMDGFGFSNFEINYIPNDTVPDPVVYKQLPPMGEVVRKNQLVEVWISMEEPPTEEEDKGDN
ncbi:PASTA domain-containing protein [Roseivirga sp.]|uniref:PASTA domain-containing protein n=1 Tax=Roseivirga sp. TaxID=1964215 RepID=UPI003B8E8E1D